MAHDALDQWIDTLALLFERDKPPTLMELSAHLTRTRGAFLGGCLEALTQELYRHYRHQRQADCPGCGKRLNAKRIDRKTERLVNRLKRWRATRAQELELDPGVLCPNASLEAIAWKNPPSSLPPARRTKSSSSLKRSTRPPISRKAHG